MKPIFKSLIAVAVELGETAKNSMPKLREGETIIREWLKNGFYYRETALEGKIFLAAFDFRLRICKCNY